MKPDRALLYGYHMDTAVPLWKVRIGFPYRTSLADVLYFAAPTFEDTVVHAHRWITASQFGRRCYFATLAGENSVHAEFLAQKSVDQFVEDYGQGSVLGIDLAGYYLHLPEDYRVKDFTIHDRSSPCALWQGIDPDGEAIFFCAATVANAYQSYRAYLDYIQQMENDRVLIYTSRPEDFGLEDNRLVTRGRFQSEEPRGPLLDELEFAEKFERIAPFVILMARYPVIDTVLRRHPD